MCDVLDVDIPYVTDTITVSLLHEVDVEGFWTPHRGHSCDAPMNVQPAVHTDVIQRPTAMTIVPRVREKDCNRKIPSVLTPAWVSHGSLSQSAIHCHQIRVHLPQSRLR